MIKVSRNRKTLAELIEASALTTYKMEIVSAEGIEAHDHEVALDEMGDGVSTEKNAHRHKVNAKVVQQANGHVHELIDPEARKKIGDRPGSMKPGSTPKKGPPKPEPSAPAAETVPAAELPAPAEVPMESFMRDWGAIGLPAATAPWVSRKVAFKKFATAMPDLVDEGDRVLDIGCDHGLLYEWLMRGKTPVQYFGIGRSLKTLKEFAQRFPEVSNRVMTLDVLNIDELPMEFFEVSTAFGLTETLEGDDREARLVKIVRFMREVSRIQIVEFKDTALSPPGDPTAWSVWRVKELYADTPHYVVRPLSAGDFAVVSYHEDLAGRD